MHSLLLYVKQAFWKLRLDKVQFSLHQIIPAIKQDGLGVALFHNIIKPFTSNWLNKCLLKDR